MVGLSTIRSILWYYCIHLHEYERIGGAEGNSV